MCLPVRLRGAAPGKASLHVGRAGLRFCCLLACPPQWKQGSPQERVMDDGDLPPSGRLHNSAKCPFGAVQSPKIWDNLPFICVLTNGSSSPACGAEQTHCHGRCRGPSVQEEVTCSVIFPASLREEGRSFGCSRSCTQRILPSCSPCSCKGLPHLGAQLCNADACF